MQVTVRTFAALAERLGQRTLTLELPPGATVEDVWRRLVAGCPDIERFERRLLVAVNLKYATWQTSLAEGDEVAFLPPVSGGADDPGSSGNFEITERPLSADDMIAKVVHPRAGGITLFAGVVREYTGERRTVHLEYEAYREMALQEMARIGREVAERWPAVRLAISHRIGTLRSGEASVMVAAAAPHRDAAFAAARYAIDRLKVIVPIWKKERWEDGEEWVGAQTGPTVSRPVPSKEAVSVLQAQEEERRRVARELHDGAAQTLANLVLRVEVCERLMDTDPERAKEELRRLKELLRASLRDIRQVIADLRPLVVEEHGLFEALRLYASEFSQRTGMAVDLHFEGELGRLDPQVELAAFRLVQECLNNANKHSGAVNVKIRIVRLDRELQGEVRDDGRGFDPRLTRPTNRFGLQGMGERLQLLGGWMELESAPGQGTAVRFGIPL
ncbi:MAG: hypothetical protein BAA04_07130 [Firmicutes bacterium ZCTH02-B6]|nr:MAG: hypothetical protein BAA04_07130 [Firmicutes bacterium ZCTH02-B6]